MEIPEGYANTRFVFSLAGVEHEMSFAIGCLPDIGKTASEVAFDMDAAFAGAGFGGSTSMCVGWTYLGTRTTKTLAGEPELGEFPLAVAGTTVGQTIPSNCAVLVRKQTAAGGRSQRGRMYVPPYGIQDNMVENNGTLVTTTKNGLQTAFTALLTQMGTRNMSPRLFHTAPGASPTTITTLAVQSLLATQRRRLR